MASQFIRNLCCVVSCADHFPINTMLTAPRFHEFIKYAKTQPPYSELQGLYPEYTCADKQPRRIVVPGGGLACMCYLYPHGYEFTVYDMSTVNGTRRGVLVDHIQHCSVPEV